MDFDHERQKLDAQLLSLGTPWEVKHLVLKFTERQVQIALG